MRAYRVSLLSDDALRQLHERARRSVQQLHDENVEVFRRSIAALNARAADCEAHIKDVAYRARNPGGCERRFFGSAEDAYQDAIRGTHVQTVEEAFEALIMGLCESVGSVGEAKISGCLPW
jgi:hypothetical protein